MESLKDLFKKSLDLRAKYSYYKEKYKDFFGDYYELIEDKFEEDPFKDYILEMLQSHDSDKLIELLQKRIFSKIDKNIKAEKNIEGNVTNIIINTPNNIIVDLIKANKEFKKLLFYFNYYITSIEDKKIYIEPKFSDKIDYFVRHDCHDRVYHITKKDKLDDILRRGLRCKKGSDYREFPEKIFLFATEKFIYPKERDKELKEFAKSIDHYGEDFVVLAINLSNQQGINIYKDAGMDCKGACYIFDDIHPDGIKVYKNTLDL